MKKLTRNVLLGISLTATALAGTAYAEQAMRGDGVQTRAEVQTRTAERFARMDANKDGKLTQAEAEAARKRAEAAGRGPAGGGPGGGGMFLTRMDANKDGAVTKAEMSAMTEQRFRMADTNKDGWLSKGELLMMRQRTRGQASE